jgi:hypothetical protein
MLLTQSIEYGFKNIKCEYAECQYLQQSLILNTFILPAED